MANPTLATPPLMFEPGFIYWAPLGSTEPTGTVVGSVFTDTWPVAWVPLGQTTTGSSFDRTLTTAAVKSAEQIDPLAYRTTDRAGTVTFMLMSFTATNLQRALNGAISTVTGTGATTMTVLDPPVPGTETRCMIGFESLDNTYRYVARQCINSGSMKLDFAKAPASTNIPFTLQLEKPATVQPFREWTAGTTRA